MIFMQVTKFDGKEVLLNLSYIDEIAEHKDGGTILWSSKPGIDHYHVTDDYQEIKKLLNFKD